MMRQDITYGRTENLRLGKRDPLQFREVQQFDEATRLGEIDYKGFTIRRENPEFFLWTITKDGQHVSGNSVGVCLHGVFTKLDMAMARIDEYLRKTDDK